MNTPHSRSQIGVHHGRALFLMANMYPGLQGTILEMVQNALDNDVRATRISIVINYRLRRMIITDNGVGISVVEFENVLQTVADPKKEKGSLGHWAIGLMSPLGKCEYHSFISCPAPQETMFNEWIFRGKDIEPQRFGIDVPIRPRPELTLAKSSHSGQQTVEWRTKIELVNFHDTALNRVEMDDLICAIRDRFSTTMRKNKVVISITIENLNGSIEKRPNVQALDFKGQPLEEVKIDNTDAGKVLLKLFIAPRVKGERKGKISVGVFNDDFRLPFQYFSRVANELLNAEVITALMSGTLEGEIIASKILLKATRDGFEKDDAYIGLCIAIEKWFNTYGRKCLEHLKESKQEERYQELGLKSLKNLNFLLHNPDLKSLLDVINSFKLSTIGSGHTNMPKKDILGEQPEKSASIDGNSIEHQEPEDSDGKKKKARKEKKGHTPLTATGPKDQNRKVVRHASCGLQLTYEPKEGSRVLWNLDEQAGILSFNIRHPLWLLAEKKDNHLMKLQEFVAIQALTLCTVQEPFKVQQRLTFDELTHSFVHWTVNADKARRSLKKD